MMPKSRSGPGRAAQGSGPLRLLATATRCEASSLRPPVRARAHWKPATGHAGRDNCKKPLLHGEVPSLDRGGVPGPCGHRYPACRGPQEAAPGPGFACRDTETRPIMTCTHPRSLSKAIRSTACRSRDPGFACTARLRVSRPIMTCSRPRRSLP